MRISLIAPAACVLAAMFASAPAQAAPRIAPGGLLGVVGGKVEDQKCAIPAIRAGSVASLRSFHRAMAKCADRFWSGRFAAAGLVYHPPEVTITTGRESACGAITSSGAQYCPLQEMIVIRIAKNDLRDPFRMNLAHSVAHEWGHHVQQLIGVLTAQAALYAPAPAGTRKLLSHRLEMQAECFAGVFYSATLESIKPDIGWKDWLTAVRMAEESDIHGKPRNLASWQDRGYRGGSPAFCNTWTAVEKKVT